MIDGQSLKNDNIRKNQLGRGDDYKTGCLLDYSYFKEHYKLISIDKGKRQVFNADPKKIQEINFRENLENARNTTTFFIIKEIKETFLNFSKGTLKVL